MSTDIERIAKQARENRERKFDTIAHYLTPEALEEAFSTLRKDASPGQDGITYSEYIKDAKGNIQALHERMRNKQYRAQPLKRVYIPKEDGSERALSIPSLEDKIVQKATLTLLNAIYEQDFFAMFKWVQTWQKPTRRPRRNRHQNMPRTNRMGARG